MMIEIPSIVHNESHYSSADHICPIKQGNAFMTSKSVTDDEEIARDGTAIALAMDHKRIVFDVDTRLARHARLTLRSKLLRLAHTVQ